jgi:uncharacterized DUF497 family protein
MLFGARPSWREVALAHQVEPVLGGPEDDFAMMERDFSVAMEKYAYDPAFVASWRVIGYVGNELLSVIYTWRRSAIRLISARFATRQERRFYHGNR